MISSIVHFYHSIPKEVWALLASSIGLSAVQMKLTKWFSLQSDKVKQFVTGLISLLAVVVPAITGLLSASPQILGAYTTLVFTGMTFSYRYVVKPASNLLKDAKAYRVQDTPAVLVVPANDFQA